ncbi:PACE efflux transporter [Micrococcus luteus]
MPTASASSDVPLGPGGRRALVGRRVFRSPAARRVVYAVVFEVLAVLFVTVLLTLVGKQADSSLLLAIANSTIALLWNLAFNTLFERWERRSGVTGRPLRVRVWHAVLFQVGLVCMLVPTVALILQVSLAEAIAIEAGLVVFFFLYTAAYAFVFDSVFGLPDSAAEPPAGTATVHPASGVDVLTGPIDQV